MHQGILLVDKPKHKTSFYLIKVLRKLTKIQKIGHTGTLDPIATGVMVLLLGKNYTRLASHFVKHTKEYTTKVLLGTVTDSFDMDGTVLSTNDQVPTLPDIKKALKNFQGTVQQTPPAFSAKKIQGKKAYELARAGTFVEMKPVSVTMETTLLNYEYPYLDLHVRCSSGTYIRSIAHDLGKILRCGACVYDLKRTKNGPFSIENCVTLEQISKDPNLIKTHLQTLENSHENLL